MIVLSIIAPGQEDTTLSKLSPSSSNESDATDKATQQLIEAYHVTADKKTQLQILSLFANNFTKESTWNLMWKAISAEVPHAVIIVQCLFWVIQQATKTVRIPSEDLMEELQHEITMTLQDQTSYNTLNQTRDFL